MAENGFVEVESSGSTGKAIETLSQPHPNNAVFYPFTEAKDFYLCSQPKNN